MMMKTPLILAAAGTLFLTACVDPNAYPDDPNARDDEDATPLHQAAWEGDLELIRRLLKAGADPSLTDGRFGSTPLQWAEHAYQTEAAELLRAATSEHH